MNPPPNCRRLRTPQCPKKVRCVSHIEGLLCWFVYVTGVLGVHLASDALGCQRGDPGTPSHAVSVGTPFEMYM